MGETTGHHDHSHQVKNFNKVFAIGIFLNVLFVVTEFYFGLKIDSLALIADAGHNLSDVAGLILAWTGLTLSRKAGDAKYSYGWKKASIFAAFGNAVFLLVAMGSLIGEALGRMNSPLLAEPGTVMVVAGVGILINGATALLFFSGSRRDLNLRGAFLHMAADALVSLGVVLAGFLTLKFGFHRIDPITSIVIAVVVVFGTAKLFFQSLHLLFDGVPDSVDFAEVRKYLLTKPGVTQIFDLHIWSLSTTEIALTAQLQVAAGVASDILLTEMTQELHDQFHIEHCTIQLSQRPIAGAGCVSAQEVNEEPSR